MNPSYKSYKGFQTLLIKYLLQLDIKTELRKF